PRRGRLRPRGARTLGGRARPARTAPPQRRPGARPRPLGRPRPCARDASRSLKPKAGVWTPAGSDPVRNSRTTASSTPLAKAREAALEPLSKCTLESSEADQAAGDRDECFVDVGATFVADTQPPMVMQPGECP